MGTFNQVHIYVVKKITLPPECFALSLRNDVVCIALEDTERKIERDSLDEGQNRGFNADVNWNEFRRQKAAVRLPVSKKDDDETNQNQKYNNCDDDNK